jgi:hypothetical protein
MSAIMVFKVKRKKPCSEKFIGKKWDIKIPNWKEREW